MKRIVFVVGLIVLCCNPLVYGQEKIAGQDAKAQDNKTEKVPSYMKEYEEGFVSKEKFSNSVNTMLKLGKTAIPHLINFAKDKSKNMWLRCRALELIGTINDTSATNSLIEILNDKTQDVAIRSEAIETLATLKDLKAGPYLVNALKDENLKIRSTAISGVGLLKYSGAVDELIKISQDERENEDGRGRAIISLGRSEDKRATDVLIQFLSDPREDFRRKAILALGEMKDAKAVDALIPVAFNKDDEANSIRAIEALGKIKDKKAVEPLMRLLKEGDSYKAKYITEALAEIGDKTTAKEIENQIKQTQDEFLRKKMKEAYKKLMGKDYKEDR